jgi:hypothetical protein
MGDSEAARLAKSQSVRDGRDVLLLFGINFFRWRQSFLRFAKQTGVKTAAHPLVVLAEKFAPDAIKQAQSHAPVNAPPVVHRPDNRKANRLSEPFCATSLPISSGVNLSFLRQSKRVWENYIPLSARPLAMTKKKIEQKFSRSSKSLMIKRSRLGKMFYSLPMRGAERGRNNSRVCLIIAGGRVIFSPYFL